MSKKMTEAEWLACTEPVNLLIQLKWKRRSGAGRKCRLFGAACCRRVWHLLTDDCIRRAIEIAEQFADGEVPTNIKTQTTKIANRAISDARHGSSTTRPSLGANLTAEWALWTPAEAIWGVGNTAGWLASNEYNSPEFREAEKAEHALLCPLVHEIAGNPFRSVSVDSAWLSVDVISVAQTAYTERSLPAGTLDPARLAVLADALEEAGCTDDAILTHLRSPGPHVRGCWALDLILGKE